MVMLPAELPPALLPAPPLALPLLLPDAPGVPPLPDALPPEPVLVLGVDSLHASNVNSAMPPIVPKRSKRSDMSHLEVKGGARTSGSHASVANPE
jgi:hypothetical protein